MRYVVAVAETGNFTRAAERCFVVQSALSHQIKALERELGFELFARTSRRVDITAAGAAFLPEARRALDAADRAVADAAAAIGEVRGRLVLGVIPTVTGIDVPAALLAFRTAHPAVSISLQVGGSDEFITGIRAGTVDVGVLGLPSGDVPTGVRSRVIARDRHVAVVAADHPLAGRRSIDLARLRDVAFESMALDIMADLVRSGLGIALLPSAVAPNDDPTLATVTLRRGPTRSEHLAWSAFNPSPAAEAFVASVDG